LKSRVGRHGPSRSMHDFRSDHPWLRPK
jgi:hypothetical protein